MVAGGGANHAACQFLGRQLCHLVVGTAQLEAEHGLLIFAFEQHFVVHAARKRFRDLQIGLDGDVIDAGGQDLLEVIKRAERWLLLVWHLAVNRH